MGESLENFKNKVVFSASHPIRYFLEGESPPIYYAKSHLISETEESEDLLSSLTPKNAEVESVKSITKLRRILHKARNDYVKGYRPDGKLIEEDKNLNHSKIRKKLTSAKSLLSILKNEGLSYSDKFRETKKMLPIFQEEVENFGRFYEIEEMEKIVEGWESLGMFNDYEKIKKWSEKWIEEMKKVEINSWKQEDYQTHIEFFQPPKEYYTRYS